MGFLLEKFRPLFCNEGEENERAVVVSEKNGQKPSKCSKSNFQGVYTAPAVLCGHQFLWSDSEDMCVARRTLLHQWHASFRFELPLPEDGSIYATETWRSESEPLKTLCHIY
jgi:hypothetical protein